MNEVNGLNVWQPLGAVEDWFCVYQKRANAAREEVVAWCRAEGLSAYDRRTGQFTLNDYRTRPTPRAQLNMPGGADAPVVPAVHVFAGLKLDLDAIKTPSDTAQKPPAKL